MNAPLVQGGRWYDVFAPVPRCKARARSCSIAFKAARMPSKTPFVFLWTSYPLLMVSGLKTASRRVEKGSHDFAAMR